MKLIDIMPVYTILRAKLGDGEQKYYGGKQKVRTVTERYADKDCVIGYYKDPAKLITVVVIKGKIKYFALHHHKFWGNHIMGGSVERFADIIENNGVIVDEEEWAMMLKKKAIEGI